MADGFKKIELEVTNSAPADMVNLNSGQVNSRLNSRPKKGMTKTPIKIFISLLIFVVLVLVLVILPVKRVYTSARAVYDQAKIAYAAAKNQDIGKASEELKKTEELLVVTKRDLNLIAWTKFIPILGAYTSDAQHFVNGGIYGTQAAEIMVDAIKPYADVLGLKGQGSFAGGSAEERIVKVVQTLDKVTPQMDQIGEKLKLVKNEIDQVDPNRYPQQFQDKFVSLKCQ